VLESRREEVEKGKGKEELEGNTDFHDSLDLH